MTRTRRYANLCYSTCDYLHNGYCPNGVMTMAIVILYLQGAVCKMRSFRGQGLTSGERNVWFVVLIFKGYKGISLSAVQSPDTELCLSFTIDAE